MEETGSAGDVLRSIAERAATDPVFRASLMDNSRLTVEAELTRLTGAEVRLPDGLELVVLEDTPERMYLVLPPTAAAPNRELSDGELDGMAGGYATLFDTPGCPPFPGRTNFFLGRRG